VPRNSWLRPWTSCRPRWKSNCGGGASGGVGAPGEQDACAAGAFPKRLPTWGTNLPQREIFPTTAQKSARPQAEDRGRAICRRSSAGNGGVDGGRNMAAAQLHWRFNSPSVTSILGRAHDLEVWGMFGNMPESTGFDPLVGSDGFDPLWCKSPNGTQML
jgi:hypothetical protein